MMHGVSVAGGGARLMPSSTKIMANWGYMKDLNEGKEGRYGRS